MAHIIKIVSRWDSSRTLYEFEASDEQQSSGLAMRAALESAIAADANLSGAYLRGANLSDANLRGANLRDANLSGANLSGDEKLIGERPVFILGPIGSRCDYFTAYITDKGLRLRAGCFFGTRDEFSKKLDGEHGDNSHGQEYRAALALVDSHVSLWTPKEDT